MEYKYFKKKKMYELLVKLVCKANLEKLKYASYKFYRGSEWIEVGTLDTDMYYKLYRCKCYISLNIFKYDESVDTYQLIDSTCYLPVYSLEDEIVYL